MRAMMIAAALLALGGTALAGDVTVLNSRALFPEGPVMADGRLIYAEYAAHALTVWDGKANATLWTKDGCGPAAVVPLADGFAVTCYDSGEIVIVSKAGKTLRSYGKDAAGAALIGPNDGTPDGKGGAWITLSGPWEPGPIVGRIVHLMPGGGLLAVADDLHYANGVATGPDGRVYVNESEAGRIVSFAVSADGGLTDRRLFARLYQMGEPPEVYPDGIKLGPNGNFFIGLYSAAAILELAPDGSAIVRRHEVPSAAAPNLTFSADGRTLYVMAVDNTAAAPYEGKVLALPLP
jgi:sugar lactone lactonase YvrE